MTLLALLSRVLTASWRVRDHLHRALRRVQIVLGSTRTPAHTLAASASTSRPRHA